MPFFARRLLRPLLAPYRRAADGTGTYVGQPLLTYLLMSVVCGFFSYRAIGKGGYTALLSAITVFVAGHGDNPLSGGLWRTVDILIGIALALAFSFALPLYADPRDEQAMARGAMQTDGKFDIARVQIKTGAAHPETLPFLSRCASLPEPDTIAVIANDAVLARQRFSRVEVHRVIVITEKERVG